MTVEPSAPLQKLRGEIDAIDQALLEMLVDRARISLQVAEIKKRQEAGTTYQPEREQEILERLQRLNKNLQSPLPNEHLERLWREILSTSRALQRSIIGGGTVAYLGPEGTFTEAAVLQRFGTSSRSEPASSIGEVFRMVEHEQVDYGVVPVENSTEGAVSDTLDAFLHSKVQIVDEVGLPIHHHFLVPKDCAIENIRRILSHPQALAQCRKWLDAHWPGTARIAMTSTSEAAALVASAQDAAAVAGDMAARRYGLSPIARNIESNPTNITRFLVIGRHQVPPTENDKTTLLVSTHDEPGALLRFLTPFQRWNVNLLRLESRPSGAKNWSYVFFIDCVGHYRNAALSAVLTDLATLDIEVTCLGSYPCST